MFRHNNPTALIIESSEKAEEIQKLLPAIDVFSYGAAKHLGSGRRYTTIFLRWPNSDFIEMTMTEEEFIRDIVANLSSLLKFGGRLIYI